MEPIATAQDGTDVTRRNQGRSAQGHSRLESFGLLVEGRERHDPPVRGQGWTLNQSNFEIACRDAPDTLDELLDGELGTGLTVRDKGIANLLGHNEGLLVRGELRDRNKGISGPHSAGTVDFEPHLRSRGVPFAGLDGLTAFGFVSLDLVELAREHPASNSTLQTRRAYPWLLGEQQIAREVRDRLSGRSFDRSQERRREHHSANLAEGAGRQYGHAWLSWLGRTACDPH